MSIKNVQKMEALLLLGDAFIEDLQRSKTGSRNQGSESPSAGRSEPKVTWLKRDLDGQRVYSSKRRKRDSSAGVKYPNKASSISLISKGPPAGLLNPTNVVQKPVPKKKPREEVKELEELNRESGPVEDTKDVQKTDNKNKSNKVQFQSVPVDISPNNDTYDFNTDFK